MPNPGYRSGNHTSASKIDDTEGLDVLRRRVKDLEQANADQASDMVALREIEERYRELVETSPDAILVHAKGKIVFANSSAARLLGRQRPEDLVGIPALEIVPPEDREEIRRRQRSVEASDGRQEYGEERFLRLDGSEVTAEVAAVRLRFGDRPAIQLVVRDITERKRADEVLQLTQFALDHANDMVFWLESSGRFIYVNDTICKLLGYSRDELLSMDITDVDLDATLEEFARSFERLRAHGPYIFEAHYRTKDGKIVPVEVSTRFMKYGDKELVNSLSRDITKRKAADEALHRAKEEAELANRTKSRFFANMSHELRTPLSAIISFSKLIRSEGYGPVGSKKYLEFAADIENSGALLLEVINDILDLSKAEAGRLELREEAVDMARALDTCVRLVLDRALAAEVEVKLEVAPGLPHLRADEHMVIQIVLNLLSNALKFTPGGGEVRLRAVLDKGGGMELVVADNGIGIAEEDLELVLTPFGQVDGSLSRQHHGTGLGLSLTNTLVELHKGRLEIASELGAGTTVTVRFPAERVIRDVSTEELPVT